MDVQLVFLSTRDKVASSTTSRCQIPLHRPLTATHFKLVSADIPNSGYSFHGDDNTWKYFKSTSGQSTTYANSSSKGLIVFDLNKRYNITDLVSEINAAFLRDGFSTEVSCSTNGSYKLSLTNLLQTGGDNDKWCFETNIKLGFPEEIRIPINTTITAPYMVDLASTKCVYLSSPTLVNNTITSYNNSKSVATSSSIIAKIAFNSANSIGDIASHMNYQTDFTKIQSSESNINEIEIVLLDDHFRPYSTNGIDSFLVFEFLNISQYDIDSAKRGTSKY